MSRSLRAMLAGIVDYAGLFPPAKQPLETAIRDYARYLNGADAWMLGRFIIPAARLNELESFVLELFTPESRLAISALGRGGPDRTAFLSGVDQDLADIATFRAEHGDRVAVEIYEVKLPADVNGLFPAIAERVEAEGLPALTPYFEAVWGPTWETAIPSIMSMIAFDRRSPNRKRCLPAGFKMRCGGLDASAFPSLEQITTAIVNCRDAEVPLKCTAGLHHPIRRFDAGVNTKMHGFINVFGAGILATAHGLEPDEIFRMLSDEDASHFSFTDDEFVWDKHRVSTAEIETARRSMTSFGSCSFDEPLDDLRKLGWLGNNT